MQTFRTRFAGDIVAEFAVPSQPNGRGVIICSGMPGVPDKRALLRFFAKRGWWAFHPRYRGTWESGGNFLDHDPTQDILDVVQEVARGHVRDVWNGVSYAVPPLEIAVVGSSFGGPAAILASRDPRVRRAVAISPVVDWVAEEKSPEEPMSALGGMVRAAFGQAYRFADADWARLAQGELYNPASYAQEIDGSKLYIVHAQDDRVVLPEPVITFAEATHAHFTLLPRGGHLSSSMIVKYIAGRRIRRFLDGRL